MVINIHQDLIKKKVGEIYLTLGMWNLKIFVSLAYVDPLLLVKIILRKVIHPQPLSLAGLMDNWWLQGPWWIAVVLTPAMSASVCAQGREDSSINTVGAPSRNARLATQAIPFLLQVQVWFNTDFNLHLVLLRKPIRGT